MLRSPLPAGSSATAFTILATPINHPSMQDHMCLEPSVREKLFLPDINSSLFYWIIWLLRSRCGSSWTKPTKRPVQAIRKVYLHDGASLHDNAPVHLRNMTTDLVPCSTEVMTSGGAQGDPFAIVHTTIELLKLFTTQVRPGSAIHNAEWLTRSDEQYWADMGKQRCLYSRPYTEWHISLCLDSSAKDLFVAKVRPAAVSPEQKVQAD